MSFNLRLPPALDAAARAHAETLGISLNAFVCISVSHHLDVLSVPGRMSDKAYKASTWRAPWADGHALSKGEVKQPKTGSKLQKTLEKPVLGPNPTKKEQAALHNWEFDQKRKVEPK
jgi:HicB family